MNYTLSDVLADVGASVDQDTTQVTGTELTVRAQFADRSQRDWANAYNWQELRINNYSPTFSVSMTSVALPTNFDRLLSQPYDASLTSGNEYPEIKAQNRINRSVTDKYVYIGGNDSSGKYMVIHPALSSGASLVFDYQATVSSVATLTDTFTCPSREFIAKRMTYYILEARSDGRYPQIKFDSDSLLQQLIEKENTPTGGEDNRIPEWSKQSNYRIGRD